MSSPNSLETTTKYLHWIHCNTCYKIYIKKECKFFLLACYHITCETCANELDGSVNGPRIYKCKVCQKSSRACEIGNGMPKNLKDLLHPEPFSEGLNSFAIISFQEKHRQRLMEHLERVEKSQNRMQQEVAKKKELTNKLFLELEAAQQERKHYEKRVKAIREQRREIDDNRSNKSLSSSSSDSGGSVKVTTAGIHDETKGITTFGSVSQGSSFVL